MTKPDLSNRTPTVQRVPAFSWPRWRPSPSKPARTLVRDPGSIDAGQGYPEKSSKSRTATKPAQAPASSTGAASPTSPTQDATSRPATLSGWLLRESVALLGMAGAALAILSQLAWVMPLSRPFMDVLGWWVTLSSDLWLANYESLGFYPHSHLQAAIALAVFLATIGLGARIAGHLSGTSFARRWGFLQGMTWPSLAIMGGFAVIFLLGYDPGATSVFADGADRGGTQKYVFSIILMLGYAAGDMLGQRGFHNRLYRLAILLIALVALNIWLLTTP